MKKTLGQTICELRKKQGMTQLDLASKLNITDKAVSKWERDLSYPDIQSLPRLAEVLNVSVDELMQVKVEAVTKNDYSSIIQLIFKCIALAMGVGVIVLSILKQLEIDQAVTMLGIGLFALSITQLDKE